MQNARVSEGSLGVIFPAFGREYVLMAANSCRSLKEVEPGCYTHLITNIPKAADSRILRELFDCVTVNNASEKEALLVKVNCLSSSPYDNTLVVDADTEVLKPIVKPILALLSRYDLGVALRLTPATTEYTLDRLPDQRWFSHWNTGVIFFRSSEKTKSLGADWLEIHLRERWGPDQPSFAKALYDNPGVNMLSLDVSWNFLPKYYSLRALVRDDIKVNHYVDVLNCPDVAERILEIDRKINQFDSDDVRDSLCLERAERLRYRFIASLLFRNPITPIARSMYNSIKPALGIKRQIGFLHKTRGWKN